MSRKRRKGIRTVVRLLILALALFLLLAGPLPVWAHRLIPAFSPLALFSVSLAQRAVFAPWFWLLPPLILLGMACWKGRLFCTWICPLGTLYSLPGNLHLPRKKIIPVRLNALLFWFIASSALLGTPLLLFADPLSSFSRLGAFYNAAAWIPGALIPLMLLISLVQPQAWCTHLCPLGYMFDLASVRNHRRVMQRDRRQFLIGCGTGLAGAWLLPRVASGDRRPAILPPGATPAFDITCTRCYACVRGCPTGVIRVQRDGRLFGLARPELFFDHAACDPQCTRCSNICPKGALRPLDVDAKQQTQIGIAKVTKERCLAWADDEFCMVCDEVCPYGAIDTHWKGDTACPVVNKSLCRGCGTCERDCPAVRDGKAILVRPLLPLGRISGL